MYLNGGMLLFLGVFEWLSLKFDIPWSTYNTKFLQLFFVSTLLYVDLKLSQLERPDWQQPCSVLENCRLFGIILLLQYHLLFFLWWYIYLGLSTSDCVRAEPVIYKKLESSSDEVALLRAYVGDRPTWRNPRHPWRSDSIFKLRGVPTLILWEDGAIKARLEDHEAHLDHKIDTLVSGN